MQIEQIRDLNNYRQYNHDQGAQLAIDAIREKIRSDLSWTSSLLRSDVLPARFGQRKPKPDGRFFSPTTKCHVALEYKPPYSSLDEIGKGFTQCFDYIVDENNDGEYLNQGSVLIVPKINEAGDNIEALYKTKFQRTVYNKNAISLVTYDPENPKKVSLISNFGPKVEPDNAKSPYGKDMIKYWASWRENYPSHNYMLLKRASLHKGAYNKDSDTKIWNDFYYNYYCYPPETVQTLDQIPNKLFVWEEEKNIWAKSKKRDLKKFINEGHLDHEQAINLLKWRSESSASKRVSLGKEIGDDVYKEARPKKWSTDNDYEDLKKNKRNFLTHVGLWDNNTWEPTDMGLHYLNRIENGADPFDEMVMLALVPGKWVQLIQDVAKAQKEIINTHSTSEEFRLELQKKFKENGNIGFNAGRAVTYTRKFHQSEGQVLARANIYKRFTPARYYLRGQGFEIDQDMLDAYISSYYEYYSPLELAA